jgi:hypothetical protein
MIVFYNPETLAVNHVVVNAPDDYMTSLKSQPELYWLETAEDIPPEEIYITRDKKVGRQKKIFSSEDVKPSYSLDEYKIIADKLIDQKSYLDMEPYLIHQKYLWATTNPIPTAIEKEAQMLNMSVKDLVSHIKHRYDEETVRLQWAELHRVKAKLDLNFASSIGDVDRILNSFDPTAPIDGILVVDNN